MSRGNLSRGSRGRDRGGADGDDPFPAGPDDDEDDDEEDDEEDDDEDKAYQEQLAALRGEGLAGEDGSGVLTAEEEAAKKAAEKVPTVAEKTYAIKVCPM